MNVLEDRVFGRPETWPSPSLHGGPSTSMDLCSVSVEGAKVVYALQGTVVRPPLVFLHGWGASHRVWRHAFSALSPRYRCIAPDFAGFGLSEKPDRDYTIDGLADWLHRFLDVMQIGRATLVAHSMGGTIGLTYALKHPERVDRLVVTNPVVRGRDAFSFGTRLSMAPGIRTVMFLGARVPWIRHRVASDFSFARELEAELVNDLARGSYAAMMTSYDSLRAVDLVEPLESLKTPAFLVSTDRDEVVLPPQSDLVPGKVAERVRIPDCGHMPMLERPAEFNRAVSEWLRKGETPVHRHKTGL